MVQRVIPANEHPCPSCVKNVIPVWRALCPNCFDIVPWKLRAGFLHAYRERVLRNRQYQELLIEVRQWFLDVQKLDKERKQ
jgi:hypothetical protein